MLDRRLQAPAGDAGGLGGGQGDGGTARPLGGQALDPERALDRPEVRPRRERREPTAQVEPERRLERERIAGDDVPVARDVGEQRVRRPRSVPDAPVREGHRHDSAASDRLGDRGVPQQRGRHGGAEQRAGHQRVGARLQGHGRVQHRPAPATGGLGQADRRGAHLGDGLPDLGEGLVGLALGRAHRLDRAQACGPPAQAGREPDVLVGDPDRHACLRGMVSTARPTTTELERVATLLGSGPMTASPVDMPADLLAHARAAKGFMPEDEGLLLHRVARERLPHGPALEVGTYCGKSAIYLGAAAREVGGDGLHRRPPPRLGGEPGRLGAPRPEPGRRRARADGHAPGVPAHPRPGRPRGPGRRRGRPIHDGVAALAHAAVDALHRRGPRRGARAERLHRLGVLAAADGAAWSSTTSSPTRPTAGSRRTTSSCARSRAATSPRWRRWGRCGCYGVRAERPGTPSVDGQPHSSASSAKCGASEVAAHDAGPLGRVAVGLPQRIDRQDHRGGRVRRVLDRPVHVVAVDPAGPVASRPRRAGAACPPAAAARAGGRRARRAPSPARRSRRRSPTGWCRRSGCRGRAPRTRPSGSRAGRRPPGRAPRRRGPGSTSPWSRSTCP